MIGSPGYPKPVEESRALAEATFDRGFSASGVMRQMLAILDQPDRSRALRELRVPSLVIHGFSDRMVHVSGGRATAAAIPGAELILVPGMGHDMPPALFGDFAEAIRFTDRVAALAEEVGHHPSLLTEWGRVTVTWWTHKIKGLHRNDFIMAAKSDAACEQQMQIEL